MYPVSYLSHNWLIKKSLNEALAPRLAELSGLVLDLGCGERPFESIFTNNNCQYIGVDWSNTLHNTRADVILDLNSPLPLKSDYVDNIVCIEVMEHLRRPELLLRESLRILKPNGSIVISVPFQWWLHEAPWDYFRYTRYGLEYLFDAAGFTHISITPTTGFWSMWILKLNYQTTRLVTGGKLTRALIRAALTPFWLANQLACSFLDRYWKEENETAGYVVTAKKP